MRTWLLLTHKSLGVGRDYTLMWTNTDENVAKETANKGQAQTTRPNSKTILHFQRRLCKILNICYEFPINSQEPKSIQTNSVC